MSLRRISTVHNAGATADRSSPGRIPSRQYGSLPTPSILWRTFTPSVSPHGRRVLRTLSPHHVAKRPPAAVSGTQEHPDPFSGTGRLSMSCPDGAPPATGKSANQASFTAAAACSRTPEKPGLMVDPRHEDDAGTVTRWFHENGVAGLDVTGPRARTGAAIRTRAQGLVRRQLSRLPDPSGLSSDVRAVRPCRRVLDLLPGSVSGDLS